MTGMLVIISAPSGGGKTSIVAALLARELTLAVSVSHTTRAMRPGEQDGANYYFVSRDRFVAMRDAGEFLESADVFGNLYGTSQSGVQGQLDSGSDVILEIDWQGARQVRNAFPDVVSIFIVPPSREVLHKRLNARGQDDATVISTRMAQAISEMSNYRDYDYLVVNDDFETAVGEVASILTTERLRRPRQEQKLAALLTELLSE